MAPASPSPSPARPVSSSSTTKTYSRRRRQHELKRRVEGDVDDDGDSDEDLFGPAKRVKRASSGFATSSPLSSPPRAGSPTPPGPADTPSPTGAAPAAGQTPALRVQPASSDPPASSAPSTPPRRARALPTLGASPRVAALFSGTGESQETLLGDGRAGASPSGSWGGGMGSGGSGGSGGWGSGGSGGSQPRQRRRMLTKAQSMAAVPGAVGADQARPDSPLARAPATPSRLSRTRSMPMTPSSANSVSAAQHAGSPAQDSPGRAGRVGPAPAAAGGSPKTTRTYARSRSFLADAAGAQHRESYAELRKKYEVDPGLDGDGAGNLVDLMLARAPEPISDMRSKGENRRFMDELAYLVDGIEASTSHALKRTSAVEVVRNMEDDSWADKLGVCGQTERVCEVLLAARSREADDVGNAVVLAFLAMLVRAEARGGRGLHSAMQGRGADALGLALDALDTRSGPLDQAYKGKATPAIQQLRGIVARMDGDDATPSTALLASRVVAAAAASPDPAVLATLSSTHPSARLLSGIASVVGPIAARLDLYEKGLPLVNEAEPLDLEYLGNALTALNTLVALPDERDSLDKRARDAKALVHLVMVLNTLALSGNAAAGKPLLLALQVLAVLADVSPAWAKATLRVPGAMTILGRTVLLRDRLAGSVDTDDGEDREKQTNGTQGKGKKAEGVSDDDDAGKDDGYAGDVLCVVLALLASLLKADKAAADAVATTRLTPCDRPACLRQCRCPESTTLGLHLVVLYLDYLKNVDDPLAPYLTGYLAFLLCLLVVASPAAAAELVVLLPGWTRQERLEGLYATLGELDGINALVHSKLRNMREGAAGAAVGADGNEDEDADAHDNVLAEAMGALRRFIDEE